MDLAGSYPKIVWDSGDLPTEWKKFRQHADFLFQGPLADKSEEIRCNYFMIWVGEKGRQIFSTWDLGEDDPTKLDTYYNRFKAYCEPKSNRIFNRYKFHCKVQGESETFDQFYTSLRVLVKDCGYADIDDMVRDRIVFGTKTSKVREKLINIGSDLTLAKAIEIARLHEMSQAQLKTMSEEDSTVSIPNRVHMIAKRGQRSNVSSDRPKHNHNDRSQRHYTGNRDRQLNNDRKCNKCGYIHKVKLGKTCNLCHGKDHFKSKCPKRFRNKGREVNFLDEEQSDNENSLFVGLIGHDIHSIENDWVEKVSINSKYINFQLDTGAKCNVINYETFKTLQYKTALRKPDASLKSFSGHCINAIGVTNLPCMYDHNCYNLKFYVIDFNAPNVLGADACKSLNLIKRVNIIETGDLPGNVADRPSNLTRSSISREFPDLFNGLGRLPVRHTIKLDSSIQPVIHAPRKVPVALKDKVRAELSRMEKLGVITKQSELTEWVNSMVVVSKPNKTRICIDPKDLNRAILREHFPMKTIEEVVANMPNAELFSKLDATSGYWQIELDEASQRLCTFNTPFGRYSCRRLPFGIKSASEVFQRCMSTLVEDIEGAEAIVDDIIIWGVDEKQHDERLRKGLQKARDSNLKCIERRRTQT